RPQRRRDRKSTNRNETKQIRELHFHILRALAIATAVPAPTARRSRSIDARHANPACSFTSVAPNRRSDENRAENENAAEFPRRRNTCERVCQFFACASQRIFLPALSTQSSLAVSFVLSAGFLLSGFLVSGFLLSAGLLLSAGFWACSSLFGASFL